MKNSKEKIRFSVIIATYNRKELVQDAIRSVLVQTFKDYELIVVDDGSTDGTSDVLKLYGNKIKSIYQVNQGSELAYINGGAQAQGEYLAFLDSDDLFFPYSLETYDKIIEEFDNLPLFLGSMTPFSDIQDVHAISDMGNTIEILKYRNYLSKDIGVGLSQSRIIMRQDIFNKVCRVGTPCFLNDYNLMLQAGIFGPCAIIQKPVTVAYRQHDSQGSKNIEKMALGTITMINTVKSGQCSGGRSHWFLKYAYLGGPVKEWSRKAFKIHRPLLALKLIFLGLPMLLAAMLRQFWLRFFRTSSQRTLHFSAHINN